MRDKSHKKQNRKKLIQKLQGALLLLLLALILPMSHGVFLPGTFFFFAQLVAFFLVAILLSITIVGSYIHMKRKRAEAERLKKDDPSK